jgi:hypothetical protein
MKQTAWRCTSAFVEGKLDEVVLESLCESEGLITSFVSSSGADGEVMVALEHASS